MADGGNYIGNNISGTKLVIMEAIFEVLYGSIPEDQLCEEVLAAKELAVMDYLDYRIQGMDRKTSTLMVTQRGATVEVVASLQYKDLFVVHNTPLRVVIPAERLCKR